jgi:hypothetical protein
MSWEDKKDNGGDATWESDTEVAGQVFEQLMVTHIGLGGPAYGIHSTFNAVRLVSNVDFGGNHEDTVTVPVRAADANANAGNTPDRVLPLPLGALRSTPSELVTLARRTNKEAEQDGCKQTRVSEIIHHGQMPREFYASRVFHLPESDDADRREKNMAVIRLIATACLLAMQSVNAPRRDVNAIPFKGPARVFNLGQKTIHNSTVELPQGIQYDLLPNAKHKIFYSFRQVGDGANAVCCLATVSNGAACALKIFREGGEAGKELAAAEEQNWASIYADQRWRFVRHTNINDTWILVLPYFHVPCNREERHALMEGREESLLWKALDRMAQKGYAHSDLKWHHVGCLTIRRKKHSIEGKEKYEKMAFLFDLGNVGVLLPSERDEWVTESFKAFESRSGF